MDYVAQTPLEKMKKAAARIVLVDLNSTPSTKLIQKCKKYADLGVSEQRYEDWYCLLRKTQGDLFPYNNDLQHMIDYSDFLRDSLFCEWAYMINLDNGQFETYKGLNKDRLARGRYANQPVDDNLGYRGVALIKEIPLVEIRTESIDGLVNELEGLSHLLTQARS